MLVALDFEVSLESLFSLVLLFNILVNQNNLRVIVFRIYKCIRACI